MPGGVTYAQGSGVDAAGITRRDALRMQAAEMLTDRVSAELVARRQRLSVRSAYRRRTAVDWAARARLGRSGWFLWVDVARATEFVKQLEHVIAASWGDRSRDEALQDEQQFSPGVSDLVLVSRGLLHQPACDALVVWVISSTPCCRSMSAQASDMRHPPA